MQNPENLQIYKEAYQLVLDIYKLQLPKNENYELARQLRRASSSIVLNISEGSARTGQKEFLQFLNQANGSAQECKTIISLCKDLNYIDLQTFNQLSDRFDKTGRMITKFSQSLRGVSNAE
jgi:four helix bundle protein